MNLISSIQTGFKQIGNFVVKESPTILTVLGVGGVITTVGMAIHGTIKAVRIVDEEKYQRAKDMSVEGDPEKQVYADEIELEPLELIQLTWRCYVPTVGLSMATIACIIGSNWINLNRQAALAALYSVSETAFKEYKEQVVEKLGEKADEKIMDGIAEKELREHPVKSSEVILTGKGETLFLEKLSGRYFKSDMQKVRKAINDLNFELLNHSMFVTVNEWYDALNLEHTDMGRFMGWRTDGMLEVHFSPQMTEDGETACIVINYKIQPHKE